MPLAITWEVELAGEGNGWTALEDVLMPVPVNAKYGIDGHGLNDRVAQTGTMTFALDNSEYNSEGLIGLYSPGHVNCLTGFRMGIGIRMVLQYADMAPYFKWRGIIDSIKPLPGLQEERRTLVTAVDFMDDLARATVRGLPVALSQRSDQIFNTIIQAMPRQPPALELGYGMEQYPFALDGSRDEGLSVMSETQKLCSSEIGFAYVKGDATQGGTLTFEDRRLRGVVTSPVATFDSFNGLESARKRDEVVNRVIVKVHPRRVDTTVATFDPTDIAGLTCWLKADAITGLNDGDPVSSWTDQSGGGNNFTNAAGSDRPTYRPGVVNGQPVVRFDGANDLLVGPTLGSLIDVASYAMFVVMKQRVSGANEFLLNDINATERMRLIVDSPATQLELMNHDGNSDSAIKTGFVSTDWNLLSAFHAAGNIGVSFNDTRDSAMVTTASGNTSNVASLVYLGAAYNGTTISAWFDGDIAEVIIYNTVLTEADRKNVESYLSNKYGIDVPYVLTGVGEVGTVVFNLDHTPFIPRNTSYSFKALYKDDEQRKARIGAMGQADPTATTDYLFNTAEDGTGIDITGQLSFEMVYSGNSADVVVMNAGPQDGYLTFMRLRGLGIYDEGEVVFEAQDLASQALYGENSRSYDMPYQSDPQVAQNAAYYLLALNKSEFTVPDSASFIASGSDFFMRQAILREISDRIHIQDDVTGIDDDFFINSVALTITSEGHLLCSWGLVPAGTDLYWILDSPTQSQLGETTRLAFGLFNRYWLLGVAPMGTDTRLG